MKKRNIIKLIVLVSIVIIITTILLFCRFYYVYHNELIRPFEQHDKNLLLKGDIAHKERDFYENIVDYQQYESKYKTSFFRRLGKYAVFQTYAFLYDDYVDESYFYIIDLGDDFDSINEENLNNFRFVDMQFFIKRKDNDYEFVYKDHIVVGDWIFYEIYNYDPYYFFSEKSYIEGFRDDMFLYSYNTKTNQIAFSVLKHDISVDCISELGLRCTIEKNILECYEWYEAQYQQ